MIRQLFNKCRTPLLMIFAVGLLCTIKGKAQTTLSVGDLAFTGYNSNSSSVDTFSFVLLRDITSNTSISFTDRGYAAIPAATWNNVGGTEGTVTWTSSTVLPVGSEVTIAGHAQGGTASARVYNPTTGVFTNNGTVNRTEGTMANSLNLAATGDQIIAFQSNNNLINGPGFTLIAGIHFGYCSSATSAATWDDVGGGTCNLGTNSSYIPPGLTNGTSAIYIPREAGAVSAYARFNCTGTPSFNAAGVKTAVYNIANWSYSSSTPLSLPSKCLFISSGPVITGHPANRTVCVNASTTFTVTASNPGTYQWQEDNGGGFVDIPASAPFSGVNTATLTINPIAASRNGYQYRCRVTNGTSVNSNPATLTVDVVSGTSSVTHVSCNGGSNGTATVTITSGQLPIASYAWSPSGGTSASASGLAANTYTCTITDNIGCTGTVQAIITEPAQPVSASINTVNNVSCPGGTNGNMTVTASGGTPGYTYLWSTAGTTASIFGLTAGTYTVTVRDSKNCPTTASATVTAPPAFVTSSSTTPVSCNGGGNGTATVTVSSGGQAPYTYQWSASAGSQSTATATGLTAGTYSVTVRDNNLCPTVVSGISVSQPTDFTVGTSQTNVSCNGGNNGTATVSVSGATSPYTYSWSPSGGTNAMASGLAMGSYTVTITDNNTCQTTRSFNITQPAAALDGNITKTDVSCNGGNNGTATVSATGGTTPYSYSWSPSGGTNATAVGLAANTYTVTVTDFNNCQITRTTTVNQPAAALDGTITKTDVSCNGGNNGTATVSVTGGTTPYSYSWSPSGGTNATATGLGANTYTVTVTDFYGCQITRTTTVNQPAAALDGTITKTDVSCNGGNNGTATVSVTGGTTPYSYSWSPSGGTNATAVGLAANTYTVTVTDFYGCQITRTTTVNQPAAALDGTITKTDVSCNGGGNGTATVIATGGTTPYSYSWSPSGGTNATATGLGANTYTVTVTDFYGCQITRTTTVNQPASTIGGLAFSSSSNVSCNGGSNGVISVTAATGGAGGFTYDWTPGTPIGDGTTTISGLAAGTYTVTATDVNGCTKDLSVTITQPSAIAGLAFSSSSNVSCNGGSNGVISVTAATGGAGGFTYDWTPGTPVGDGTTTISGLAAGTYTVTATDVNGCTKDLSVTITQPSAIAGLAFSSSSNVSCNGGSNGNISVTAATGGAGGFTYDWTPGTPVGDGTTTISGLAAGTYTVTATDVNGCTKDLSVTIMEPSAIGGLAFSSSSNVSCNGGSNGSISVTAATGGTGTITYDWTPGTPVGDGTTTISGLVAGTYTVTATDANGCTKQLPVTITEPTAIAGLAFSSSSNVSCNGGSNGSISVTAATGGTGTITYDWTPGTPVGDGTTTISGLAVGTYTVTATDANGCTKQLPVTITEPTAIAGLAFSSSSNVSCNGGSNGSISVTTATGGTGTITYDWTPGTPIGDGTTTISGLAAGTYTVTATDANGCTKTLPVTITEPAILLATPSQVNVSCNGLSTGSASVVVTGGTGAYTYSWSPTGGSAATASNLTAGTYTVTIRDANSCEVTESFTITEPAVAVSSISATACGSYTLNGTTYTTSGIYIQSFTTLKGCDSTLTLNLTMNNASAYTFAATACDSYTLNGTTYTTSGSYVQTLPNASGCDSTLTLNLTVNYSSSSSMTATACDNYTLNGTTYTASGIYTQVRPNAIGCDSTITLNLTINNSTNYTLTTTACDSYTLNGQTYTQSGTYTQVLTNQVGCDWNFTLNLTILHSTSTSLTEVACGSYTLNGQTYTSSGTYTQTFENSLGCDSIVTLNLTIKTATGSSLTQTACGSFTLNNQTYNASGTYSQTFVNAVGCDSIVTLHLTIKNLNVDVERSGFVLTAEANNATYQWLNCNGFTPISGATAQSYTVTSSGDYAVVVTQDGCTDTSACIAVYGVSISENDMKNIEVTIYPNPTLDYVYIQTGGVIESVDVMDISGKKYQSNFSFGKLDLTTMPSGIYLVRVTLNNGQQALTRVIKM